MAVVVDLNTEGHLGHHLVIQRSDSPYSTWEKGKFVIIKRKISTIKLLFYVSLFFISYFIIFYPKIFIKEIKKE